MRSPRRSKASAGSALAALLVAAEAQCFPGVLVGKDATFRSVHTTHEVVMRKGRVSVVTMMIDYDGPLGPFAVIVPVPSDVTVDRVRAVKREFMARLEQLSAPRFHAFYEMDPCDPAPVEQDWEVRYEAPDSGFLAPTFMPPPERNWIVPNEIGIATKPVFKREESEFRFQVLQPHALGAWLSARGYRAEPDSLAALSLAPREQSKVLVAEVNTERVELLGNGGVQLGGIRYWSRQPVERIDSTLGLRNSAGMQDLFLYVLHPTERYQAKNYANVFLPTNIEVDPAAAEQLAPLYNALFDSQLARGPSGVVTEFAWPTAGCGEPCPNAPLTLYELMSLGGDVMETEFVTPAARNPDPGPEPPEERSEFELLQQDKQPVERAQAKRDHQKDRWELARRRALIARQRYVMTRLHFRYNRSSLPKNIEIEAALGAVQGGIGIPQGPQGLLGNGVVAAKENRFQMRFVSLFDWTKGLACPAPSRWRWGRRWKSLDAVLRKVWLGEDLPRAGRDAQQLARQVRKPLAELGLAPLPSVPTPVSKAVKRSSCSVQMPRQNPSLVALLTLALVLRVMRRIR